MSSYMKKSAYKSLIFDCDGVLLNSNELKTQAFYQAALPYGETAAQALVKHHIQNGGISRYKKFEHFVKEILKVEETSSQLQSLLNAYASYVEEGLLKCQIAPGLEKLRQMLPHTRWLVVSGGKQDELCNIFLQRGISELFNGGIFGSPDTKEMILLREKENGNLKMPALFLGDSKYDYYAARSLNLDFVFVSGWSEFEDYQDFARENSLASIDKVSDLLLLVSEDRYKGENHLY